MRRTELAQVMPWRERVPWNGTASRGQNTLRMYTILLQGKQHNTTLSISHEQNWACSSYAMARKGAMKWNSFARTILQPAFPAMGNLVVKYCKCCICCFLFIPLSPSFFGWFFFVREETWIVARFTMEYPPRTQLRCLLFFCLQNWPLGQSY